MCLCVHALSHSKMSGDILTSLGYIDLVTVYIEGGGNKLVFIGTDTLPTMLTFAISFLKTLVILRLSEISAIIPA